MRNILEKDDFTPASYANDVEAKAKSLEAIGDEPNTAFYLDRLGLKPKSLTLDTRDSVLLDLKQGLASAAASPHSTLRGPPPGLERHIRSDSAATDATAVEPPPMPKPKSEPESEYEHPRALSPPRHAMRLTLAPTREEPEPEEPQAPLPTPLARPSLDPARAFGVPPNAYKRYGSERTESRPTSVVSEGLYRQSMSSTATHGTQTTQGTFGARR